MLAERSSIKYELLLIKLGQQETLLFASLCVRFLIIVTITVPTFLNNLLHFLFVFSSIFAVQLRCFIVGRTVWIRIV